MTRAEYEEFYFAAIEVWFAAAQKNLMRQIETGALPWLAEGDSLKLSYTGNFDPRDVIALARNLGIELPRPGVAHVTEIKPKEPS